jgi:hypothetical protein
MDEFETAIAAIDAGDVAALERLLAAHPQLVHERREGGEGYFARPYLLWFVAGNPVRNERLPSNIAAVTRTLIDAGASQLDYALSLVSSGRVARESGVQRELIDVLIDAGASPDSAMLAALAHHELDAVERLLERGATLTLLAAICTSRDALALLDTASAEERQLAFAGAALYGNAAMLAALLERGVDVNAFSPEGMHPHATALHHAVASGSLDAVKVLVEAGAARDLRDRVYAGTPLEWAEYLEKTDIAAYLVAQG